MQISELATGLGQGITFRRYTITYLDLQAISGSGAKTVTIFTLPAYAMIMGTRKYHSASFTGGSISAMTASIGKSGTATYFDATLDIFAAPGDTGVTETALFKHGQKTALPVIVTFTPTGDSVSACTAGVLEVDVAMLVPSVDFSTIS